MTKQPRFYTEMSLPALMRACEGEARLSRREEKGYCFELFQRAIDDGDDAAWSALQIQYQQLVLSWVYNRLPDASPEKVSDLTQGTMEKFWRTLTAHTTPLAERFPHVGSLLNYLRQCAFTTVVDDQRRMQRQARLEQKLQTLHQLRSDATDPEQTVLDQLFQERRLAEVQTWLQEHVTDEQEKLILFLSFEQNLSPMEIARHRPDHFPDAQTVRRIKERVLKRARRALSQ